MYDIRGNQNPEHKNYSYPADGVTDSEDRRAAEKELEEKVHFKWCNRILNLSWKEFYVCCCNVAFSLVEHKVIRRCLYKIYAFYV